MAISNVSSTRRKLVAGILTIVPMVILLLIPIADPATAAVTQVNVANFVFTPHHVTIAAGDTVRWVWVSGTHTATSGDTTACTSNGIFDGPVDSAHPSFQFSFASTGEYSYFCRFHCMAGMVGRVTVLINPAAAPEGTFRSPSLLEARPNPFRPGTTLSFRLDQPARVRLEVFDAAGRFVALLADDQFEAGEHTVPWNGRTRDGNDAASGIYFVRRTAFGPGQGNGGPSVARAVVMRIR
jgi:plastocyanin